MAIWGAVNGGLNGNKKNVKKKIIKRQKSASKPQYVRILLENTKQCNYQQNVKE